MTTNSRRDTRREFLRSSLSQAALLAAAGRGVGWLQRRDAWAEEAGAPVQSPQSRAVAPSGDAWPLFRGDSQCRGVAPGPLGDKLELKWKHTVKQGGFEGTAAIAADHAFVGDLNGNLYAITMATGQIAWQQKINEFGFSSSPAWHEGRLFVGDFDGIFYCLDAADGKELWRHTAGAEINSCGNFFQGNVLFGSQDATLYCLDAETGALRWKYTIEDQIQCTPAVVGNHAFVAGCDARLHVLDLTAGKSTAAIPLDGPTGVTPAVSGSMVYIGTESGTFFGIDWQAATVVWTYRPERGDTSYRSSAAVDDQHVVVGSRNKQVTCFAPRTGEVRWQFTARRRVDSSPVIVGDRAYVGVTDGRLYGLSLAHGTADWEYETGGSLSASPAVAQSRLVIANDNGTVYCFG